MDISIQESWRMDDGRFQCPCCKREYALTALIGHMKRAGCWEMIQNGEMIMNADGTYSPNPDYTGPTM